jgi:hypothetical protein
MCLREAAAFHGYTNTNQVLELMHKPATDVKISPQKKAMVIVDEYIKAGLKYREDKPEYTIYIVWFCKTLQHWKAMVCSDLPDQEYYEVTYNGDKEEAYLDVYRKYDNIRIVDNHKGVFRDGSTREEPLDHTLFGG